MNRGRPALRGRYLPNDEREKKETNSSRGSEEGAVKEEGESARKPGA